MDFSVFSDENFDAKEWINSALQTEDAGKNKEAYVGTLVMKLQLFIQEINNSLEETGQHVLHSIPRILRDVEAIHQESILLRDQMLAMKADIKKVEQDTAQSMQTLVKIDNVKNRMINTNQALQEADNWTSLSSDVEEYFQCGDIPKVAEKLIGMQQSLEILTDVPDYEDRCQHLEKLKDKLEALTSPQLVASLNSQSSDLAQVYVGVFKDINRIDQFWKYYHKCCKVQLLAEWRKIVENEQDEGIIDWLNAFYDKLLSTWHHQIRWCQTAVSGCNPVQVICTLFANVITHLDPSQTFCINSAIKSLSPSPSLFLLCDVKQISDRFTKSIQGFIQNIDHAHLVLPEVKDFLDAVYAPFVEHVSKFCDIEQKILMEHLKSLDMPKEDVLDSVRVFGDSVNKVITYIEEACDHCKHFSMDCAYPGLIVGITNFFIYYTKEVSKVIVQLESHIENVPNGEDWSVFQQTLQATQFCGELLNRIESFDQDMVSSVLEIGRQMNISSQNDAALQFLTVCNHFSNSRELLLNNSSRKALKTLVLKIQQDTNASVLSKPIRLIQELCETFCKLLFSIMFDPIKKQLSGVTSMTKWSEKSPGGTLTTQLPTFSMLPQEYITQIGQHLITLPQHIEPFVVDDNPALQIALKNGKLPYILEQSSSHLTDILLSSVVQGTSQTYCDTVIRIQYMTSSSVKQLITDIEYLCNVLDDLGLKPADNDPLQIVLNLLSTPLDQFAKVSQGKPGHLVSAVRRLRNL